MDRYEFPGIRGAIPRASITFEGAIRACQARGKRLCTEAEFDRACGGLDGWHHPYGPAYVPGRCNDEVVSDVGSDRWLAPSGAFEACMSPEGVYDLEGNLSEWVDQGTTPGDAADDPWPSAAVRGGTMWLAIYGSGCHARHLHYAFGPTSNDDGFRCCIDAPPAGQLELPPPRHPHGALLSPVPPTPGHARGGVR
jgi:formylglycine-generating enzyme required for sulfatase activity